MRTEERSVLPFSKMHGAGNDFVVLDLRRVAEPSPDLCRAFSDRNFGVGCDLILGIGPPRSSRAVASYSIWTSAGQRPVQCGNGARCVAAWVARAGMTRDATFWLDSPCGTHEVNALPDGEYQIAMGTPEFPLHKITGQSPSPGASRVLQLSGGLTITYYEVSMGNPHAVIEVPNVDETAVADVGAAVRAAGILPESVNVGFVEVVSRERVKLRVYEYGAGETLACGSGACAAVAALRRQGSLDSQVTVSVRGGELKVSWLSTAAEMKMSGPAKLVYEGVFMLAI